MKRYQPRNPTPPRSLDDDIARRARATCAHGDDARARARRVPPSGAPCASPGPRTFVPEDLSTLSTMGGRERRERRWERRPNVATSSSESESRERLHAPGRHRFYVDGQARRGRGGGLVARTKHAVKALRLRVGDALEVCDGVGSLGYGRLVDVSGAVATVEVDEIRTTRSGAARIGAS